MADSDWTAPILEELSIPGGTHANPNADDACTDDACFS
jgi:hypothetical protein